MIDLLHEWDTDNSGDVDRKEFHRAIKALGFGALANKKDIDAVFDLYDTSGDGLIQFQELNKMLRAGAQIDAMAVGGVQGRVALEAEKNAKLKRTEKARVGVEKVVTLPTDPAKAHAQQRGFRC